MAAQSEEVGMRPSPRMVHVWAIKVLIIPLPLWAFLFWVFILTPFLAFPETRQQTLPLLLSWLVYGLLIVAVGYAWAAMYGTRYRWRRTEEEIYIWRGILFRKRIAIPYMRVQNVNVVRGPLLLLFGLSGIEIETAGQKGYHSSFYRTEGYLPGLMDGERLADEILTKVKRRETEAV